MKRLSLILPLLAFCLCLTAQPRLPKDEMYIGAHAGVLASIINFNPNIAQSALQPFWGANAGFVFRYSGQKCCGLQVELNYMQRGWHETATNYRRAVDYIELPFLTHIYFGKKFRGFINLGPQIGIAVHERHYNLPEATAPQYLSIDNRFDWGLAGGLGMLYRSKAGVYQLEARFNYSFGDMFSNRKADYFENSNPMCLSLNFAWMWQIR